MSRYDYGGWAPYVSVAERRRKAEGEIAKLRRQGYPVAPVTIAGRRIAATFWGKAWCDNLESYRDFEYRLPRGRSCVRGGLVLDLQITGGKITALVSGSETYRVSITIAEIAAAKWKAIRTDCSSGIDSLVDLLQGRFSNGIMERLCQQDAGLFPEPKEIRFSCTCPDHASMCKHVAAALYGVGARLDLASELLFQLRGVDAGDLVAEVDASLPVSTTNVHADRLLATDDLSALFGLDIAEQPAAPQETPHGRPPRKSAPPTSRRSAPAATSDRGEPPDISGMAVLVYAVDVSIERVPRRVLNVVVWDGGSPERMLSTRLDFTRKTPGEDLARARAFVEKAIEELLDSRWARLFVKSYGWQFSETGFDPRRGLSIRATNPSRSSSEQTAIPPSKTTRPTRKAHRPKEASPPQRK